MHPPDLRSRLLAILAADAAGYSRLMSLDELATVAALDTARAVFREQIAVHGGRVIDTAGDTWSFPAETGLRQAQPERSCRLAELHRQSGRFMTGSQHQGSGDRHASVYQTWRGYNATPYRSETHGRRYLNDPPRAFPGRILLQWQHVQLTSCDHCVSPTARCTGSAR